MNPVENFELDPRLERDTLTLGRFRLCRLLLMNESRYPWLILVPERAGVTEIHDLSVTDQHCLIQESSLLGRHLLLAFGADKLNVAALGNRVPQLHVHHVARFRSDPVWPDPVWGRFEPEPYAPPALAEFLRRLDRRSLSGFADAWPA